MTRFHCSALEIAMIRCWTEQVYEYNVKIVVKYRPQRFSRLLFRI